MELIGALVVAGFGIGFILFLGIMVLVIRHDKNKRGEL